MKLLSHLPLRVLQGLGNTAGFILNRFPNEPRRISQINIARCFPDYTKEQQAQLLSASLKELGKSLFELPAFWFWPVKKVLRAVTKVSGIEEVNQAFQQGQGIILLSPHLGAWELLNFYLANHYPLNVLYKPTKQISLSNIIHHARKRSGAILAPADASGVKTLYKAIKQGEAVVLLPDQNPGQKGCEFANFFGQTAATMTLVNRLMQRNQPPVFFMYAERLADAKGFHIHFKRGSTLIGSVDPIEGASQLNLGLEDCIRHIPHQYLWVYKRFKQLPHGCASIYQRHKKVSAQKSQH